jgi:hypothetical protein
MKNTFSIYDSPFSDETKRLRRNVIFASSICIFIGMTRHLPSSFALWGAQFSSAQQTTIGWLLFSITLYLFLHFFASACIEVAKWAQPFYEGVVAKKNILRHPEYDETDWMELFRDDEPADVVESAKNQAHIHVTKKLRHLYNFVYLKLFIEVLLPVAIGAIGLTKLALLLLCEATT